MSNVHPFPGWRERVREAALSWVGTPYHDKGQVKGLDGGCDCVTLLIGVFSEAGVIAWFKPPWYSGQGPQHVPGEQYVQAILQFTEPVTPPWKVGDVLMFRLRHAPSSGHAAIYIGGNEVIHAYWRQRRVMRDTLATPLLATALSGAYGYRGPVD